MLSSNYICTFLIKRNLAMLCSSGHCSFRRNNKKMTTKSILQFADNLLHANTLLPSNTEKEKKLVGFFI